MENKKKTATNIILAILLIAFITIPLVFGIFNIFNKKNNGFNMSNEEVMAFAMYSSASALSDNAQAVQNLQKTNNVSNVLNAGATADLSTEQKKIFESYIGTFNNFLNGNKIGESVTNNDKSIEKYNMYEKVMTISAKKLDGTTETNKIYYSEEVVNKEEIGEEVEVGKSKEYVSLDGVMLIGEQEYKMVGKREKETDKEESEEELMMKIYLGDKRNDSGARIEFVQELEAETEEGQTEREMEYVYNTYNESNELVYTSTFEFEVEGDELEIEFSIVENGNTLFSEIESLDKNGKEYLIKILADEESEEPTVEYKLKVIENEGAEPTYEYTKIEKENKAD